MESFGLGGQGRAVTARCPGLVVGSCAPCSVPLWCLPSCCSGCLGASCQGKEVLRGGGGRRGRSGLQAVSAKGDKVCLTSITQSPGAEQEQLPGGCLHLCSTVSSGFVPLGGKGSIPGGATCPTAGGGGRAGWEGKRISEKVQLVKVTTASDRLG